MVPGVKVSALLPGPVGWKVCRLWQDTKGPNPGPQKLVNKFRVSRNYWGGLDLLAEIPEEPKFKRPKGGGKLV